MHKSRVNHNSGNPVMLAGARYNDSNANYGLSYVNYTNASNNNANYGSRHLVMVITHLYRARIYPSPLGENLAYRTAFSRSSLERRRS